MLLLATQAEPQTRAQRHPNLRPAAAAPPLSARRGDSEIRSAVGS
jgi:hypothetical protein